MTVRVNKKTFNIREKLSELERPSVDKLITKDENGAYIDTIRGDTKLEKIIASKNDTAIDIFVYDTSKDSDGGAWRKRTQHTSWYNETLNTSIRGSRREFPAVAVIVMQEGTLTIYDGDDPDLPMWMIFTDNNDTGSLFASAKMLSCRTATSIFMLNGIFVCGGKAPYHDGVTEINFLTDSAKKYMNNGHYYNTLNISQRENTGGYYTVTSGTPSIINNLINDVSMTVMPNAPIDSATGLPVPTIAVATNTGLSVLKDDETVANINRSTNRVHRLNFDDEYALIFSWGTTTAYPRHITRFDPSLWSETSSSSTNWTDNYLSGDREGVGAAAASYNSASGGFVRIANSGRHFNINYFDNYVSGEANGDDRVAVFEPLNYTNKLNQNLTAFITSSYNTGWMPGSMRGAFFCDTDANRIGAPKEIVSNGTFDSNVDGWTPNQGSISYSSGVLSATGESAWQTVGFTKNYEFTPGKEYYITWTMTGTSARGVIDYSYGVLDPITGGTPGSVSTYYYPNAGTHTVRYVPRVANPNLNFVWYNTTANSGTLDNVSITPAVKDCSHIGKGLQVVGTITKTAVATGADLVSYGGYSSSNYLIQSSITAPGTGDFSITAWVKPGAIGSGSGNYMHLFSVGTESSGGQGRSPGFVLKMSTDTTSTGFSPYFYSGSGGSNGTYDTNNYLIVGKWSQLTAIRRGGVPYIYINGKLVKTGSSWTSNLTDTYLTVFRGIGYNEYGGEAQVALLRYSTSAPTDEQIKKMYDDEKHFFKDNAKCTLYGSSNRIYGLAYDEVTKRFHAGTSAGRSDFQGLHRINNTTTAVTTAISAHDGLIVEQ